MREMFLLYGIYLGLAQNTVTWDLNATSKPNYVVTHFVPRSYLETSLYSIILLYLLFIVNHFLNINSIRKCIIRQQTVVEQYIVPVIQNYIIPVIFGILHGIPLCH
jgi:hypothetical protein